MVNKTWAMVSKVWKISFHDYNIWTMVRKVLTYFSLYFNIWMMVNKVWASAVWCHEHMKMYFKTIQAMNNGR